ncbi:sensor histidine kinase [Pseudoalteromonas obscura]|uniref:histidine kinase n=1 Tax=Pseudoalteromonas obscura TaxID=3048491 RepID=A0ABT7ERX7_9GAMM|nr:ATP-binding protein [Pseudoalteromonas sp. P94(2023)]MDK2597768.1 ATP-binding protein [Pseudoalteromonas sp. P94(2023)]
MDIQIKAMLGTISLLFSGALLYLSITHYGVSAVTAVMLLIAIMHIAWISRLFQQTLRYPEQLFRALANGDHTLGLPLAHPLRKSYEQARAHMQAAQIDAERQVQFINAVFNHMDLPMLICDEHEQVIEQSTAASKQLGIKIKHLKSLNAGSTEVYKFISEANTNKHGTFTWQHKEQPDTLYIQVSTLRVQYQEYKVVTLQPITEQLNAKEQQAYKQLTKVLTHEVANSITPLASMAQTCLTLLPEGLTFDEQEDKQDLSLALTTLASRSTHLSEFIQEFRQLSNLPASKLQPTNLNELLNSIKQLFTAQHPDVQFEVTCATHTMCTLDVKQIEQVLINLGKNAIEAMTTTTHIAPKIQLTSLVNEQGQLCVDISDNGPGVSEQASKMMFVPFFSTKQQGSGIGLSLSRQIMVQHGGELIYLNRPKGACFRCVFG